MSLKLPWNVQAQKVTYMLPPANAQGPLRNRESKDLKRQRPMRTGAEQCLLDVRGPLLS